MKEKLTFDKLKKTHINSTHEKSKTNLDNAEEN